MKRITIVVPDELNALLQQERRRRDVSVAEVVREAIEAYLRSNGHAKQYSIIGIGRSKYRDTARNFEAVLAEEWDRDRDR
ncbi:MAG: CopG family transcriptional regulator [Dehalococcoidia bacterium]